LSPAASSRGKGGIISVAEGGATARAADKNARWETRRDRTGGSRSSSPAPPPPPPPPRRNPNRGSSTAAFVTNDDLRTLAVRGHRGGVIRLTVAQGSSDGESGAEGHADRSVQHGPRREAKRPSSFPRHVANAVPETPAFPHSTQWRLRHGPPAPKPINGAATKWAHGTHVVAVAVLPSAEHAGPTRHQRGSPCASR